MKIIALQEKLEELKIMKNRVVQDQFIMELEAPEKIFYYNFGGARISDFEMTCILVNILVFVIVMLVFGISKSSLQPNRRSQEELE